MNETVGRSEVAVIDVHGMTCEHCARRVQQALAAAPGVASAAVDLARGEAHVTYDAAAVSIARLMQAVNAAGFAAEGFTRGPARP